MDVPLTLTILVSVTSFAFDGFMLWWLELLQVTVTFAADAVVGRRPTNIRQQRSILMARFNFIKALSFLFYLCCFPALIFTAFLSGRRVNYS